MGSILLVDDQPLYDVADEFGTDRRLANLVIAQAVNDHIAETANGIHNDQKALARKAVQIIRLARKKQHFEVAAMKLAGLSRWLERKATHFDATFEMPDVFPSLKFSLLHGAQIEWFEREGKSSQFAVRARLAAVRARECLTTAIEAADDITAQLDRARAELKSLKESLGEATGTDFLFSQKHATDLSFWCQVAGLNVSYLREIVTRRRAALVAAFLEEQKIQAAKGQRLRQKRLQKRQQAAEQTQTTTTKASAAYA